MQELMLPVRHEWLARERAYGKIAIEPFEPGFALTAGNAYRRVLLSSIAGAAPTWVKIEGVLEYKDGSADDISGITVDGDTVTFKLTQKDGGFLNVLAMGFACIVPADAPHQKTNLPPPMTGPYMVTEHTQGKSLKIDRNPEWENNLAAGLPGPDDDHVDAEGAERIHLRGLKAAAETEKHHEGSDPPEDPEQGQAASEPVAGQVAKGIQKHRSGLTRT